MWITILLSLLSAAMPYIVDLLKKIFGKIDEMPTLRERQAARKEVAQVVRQNLRKRNGKKEYVLRTSEDTVKQELEALLSKYEAKVA